MKDKAARALAIVALVFMGIFLCALIAAIIDGTLLGGSIGVIALVSGVVVLVLFFILKADGRGYSLTAMKEQSEMQKIEQALKEQEEREKAEASTATDENPQAGPDNNAEKSENP